MQRLACVVMHAEGQLRKDIAAKVGTSIPSVRHWVNHYAQHTDVLDEQHTGRPRSTDENTDINIAVVSEVEPHHSTPKQVKRKLDLHVSPRTVRRRLDEAGLFGRVEREEHQLSQYDRQRRLAFAHGYRSWTKQQWRRVIVSDEKKWTLGQHGQQWVQRPKGQAYNPKYTHVNNENSTLVTLWGCFAAHEIGQAEIFTGELNGKKYCSILEGNLKPTYKKIFPQGERGEQWYFLQDNDPSHTCSAARQWFHRNGVTVLDFPPWSPDLNPIENLWSVLVRAVDNHNALDEAELEAAIAAEWQAVDPQYLTTLMESMPDRLAEVIANDGHKTHN
jgi:transposase